MLIASAIICSPATFGPNFFVGIQSGYERRRVFRIPHHGIEVDDAIEESTAAYPCIETGTQLSFSGTRNWQKAHIQKAS
jgi:hypothetical protein